MANGLIHKKKPRQSHVYFYCVKMKKNCLLCYHKCPYLDRLDHMTGYVLRLCFFSDLCSYKCQCDFEQAFLTSGTQPGSSRFTLALYVGRKMHFEVLPKLI